MDRRDFFASVFSGLKPIKETMISFLEISKKLVALFILLILASFLVSIDYRSVNWAGFAGIFVDLIVKYWAYIVIGIGILLTISLIRRSLSSSARKIFDKWVDIISTIAAAIFFVWIIYKEYKEGDYWTIALVLIILLPGGIRWLRRKRVKTE